MDSASGTKWLQETIDALLAGCDLRGYVDGKGWAHAVAHMADTLCQFARIPLTAMDQQGHMLEAIAGWLTPSSDAVFVQDEGGRLMRAAYFPMLRDDLPRTTYVDWLGGFKATLDGRT